MDLTILDTIDSAHVRAKRHTIDLRSHSLNAVVGRNRSLWKSPSRWTWGHLMALGFGLLSDAEIEYRNKDRPSLHAIIPVVPQDSLQRLIAQFICSWNPWTKVRALNYLLLFMEPHASEDVKVDLGKPPSNDGIVFSFHGARIIGLVVGPRWHALSQAYKFDLGPMVFFYVNSTQIIPSPPHINESCIACITAIMVAIAQREERSPDGPVVVVRCYFC
ncbi:hypothetical protein F5B22DRAFT_618173 [Xylaria bambusicola]|uniref:uncharacterized protein n=1 Tax=Xylaria bambusicola TaxID=326684 RepID=UPI002008190E|nr:uncharacterized protein F5B22DRAFT_618173 [Xylaria bambusicola]KAI0509243.1 hypothetical protein F5B22DRAFT_618173 [Xylaria bambusicola]